MKKLLAVLVATLLVVTAVVTLAACSSDDGIVVWVGTESEAFYKTIAQEYIEKYNETHAESFPYKITIKGVDSSTAADAVTNDAAAGPDIFTIPHDNLGKLTGERPIIAAITDSELLAQIEADNPDGYKDVIKANIGGEEHVVAVPYIGQALVLYYNKDQITEDEVKTWEGIMAAAKRVGANTKATFPMGNDCYNLSLFTLARKIDARDAAGNITATSTSVKLYELDAEVAEKENTLKGYLAGTHFTGDDTMAVYKWAQRFFADPNGGMLIGDDGISTTITSGQAITLIGGAWKFNDVKAAWGDKLAVAELPEFTITEADAYGSITAGTTFKSGTFADCKALVINGFAAEEHFEYLQGIVKYFSSKEVQERSFEACQNLPAYKNASTEFAAMQQDTIEAQLAKMQVAMGSYAIPQPFGYATLLNNYYYSKGADTIIQDIILKRDSANDNVLAYNTDALLLAGLQRVETIWKTGK